MASPVTNRMLDAQKEPNCVAVTHERKYYRDGATWIKRSLPPAEWQVNEITGTYFVPRFGRERILNEAACLRYIAEHTDIPVPRVHCCFEDRGAAYLVMDYLEGVQMAELNEEDRTVVQQEVERHRETLRTLRSTQWGGPTGLTIPPYRVMVHGPRPEWKMRPRNGLVFCHNDLSTHNIIVDPQSLRIHGIIDWEYAGFFPPEFEGAYYRRVGPSVALGDEPDDAESLYEVLLGDAEPLGDVERQDPQQSTTESTDS